MFHGHRIVIECEGDEAAVQDLISLIETQAPYMMDNVSVTSKWSLDGSIEALGEVARMTFPNGAFSTDNDGQLVLYTNVQVLTSEDNPSIPEGETVVQDMA